MSRPRANAVARQAVVEAFEEILSRRYPGVSFSVPRDERRMTACGICGKTLKDWRACPADNLAMDCGGDCLECVRELEVDEARRYVIYTELGNSVAYLSDRAESLAAFDEYSREKPDIELALVRYDDDGKIVERLR